MRKESTTDSPSIVKTTEDVSSKEGADAYKEAL